MSTAAHEESFGNLLRRWRSHRRCTQLALALDAEISARHLSFLETGRARPSREMVLVLASALELPLDERNRLLLAAGFAPAYRAEGLASDDAALVQRALRFLLVRHEPYPAFVVDPSWQVVLANDAFRRFACWLDGSTPDVAPRPERVVESPPIVGSNPLVSLFDPEAWRPMVRNFDTIAPVMLAHLRRAARDSPAARTTLERVEDLCPSFHQTSHDGLLPLVVPLRICSRQGQELSLFSTMTMMGTATDVVLSSLRLETYFPADERADELLRTIASNPPESHDSTRSAAR